MPIKLKIVENTKKAKATACQLQSYTDTIKILRNTKKLKSDNIFINEDFVEITLQLRTKCLLKLDKTKKFGYLLLHNVRPLLPKFHFSR